jgi:hypothetical protein
MLFNSTQIEGESQYIEDSDGDGAQVTSTADGGNLNYLINKILFVRNDGTYSVLDNGVMRLNRLNKRLKCWEGIVRDAIRFDSARAYKIGLNYRPGERWKPNHITEYIGNLADYLGSENLVAYAWVAEMQKRGAVHYHAQIITPGNCRKIRLPDKSGDWKYGGSERDEIFYLDIGYLTSDYMRKKEQKSNYPRGIRTHAVMLNKKYFDNCDLWALRSCSYPVWLVDKINNNGLINPKISHAKGGGYVVKTSGVEIYFKGDGGYVLTGSKAARFLDMEKYKYPGDLPF